MNGDEMPLSRASSAIFSMLTQPTSGLRRLYTWPPAASVSTWAPRQMPHTGAPWCSMRRIRFFSSARKGNSFSWVTCMDPPSEMSAERSAGHAGSGSPMSRRRIS